MCGGSNWLVVMLVPLGLAWLVVWRESRLARRLGYDHMGEPRIRSLLISTLVISAAIVVAPIAAPGMLLCLSMKQTR